MVLEQTLPVRLPSQLVRPNVFLTLAASATFKQILQIDRRAVVVVPAEAVKKYQLASVSVAIITTTTNRNRKTARNINEQDGKV